jgi:hypothetical protein
VFRRFGTRTGIFAALLRIARSWQDLVQRICPPLTGLPRAAPACADEG